MLNAGTSLFRYGATVLTSGRKMASTMRAVVVRQFGAPDVLKVEEVPVPKQGEKEVSEI